ncbi:hypothetical protein [Streptomyces yangpuensis]|uniref:hypothetical protein n=1 Tax=Streptomyces yangpuensis TaxID=1648182 RepID=UPI003687B7EB
MALPGDRADGGMRPVWFAGSTLARDLSLPRVRERFTPHLAPADWALTETRIREASALPGPRRTSRQCWRRRNPW